MQTALASRGGIFEKTRIAPAIDGSSAWTDAGPWQVSHPRLDAGDRA
jgi:hypothetical protein